MESVNITQSTMTQSLVSQYRRKLVKHIQNAGYFSIVQSISSANTKVLYYNCIPHHLKCFFKNQLCINFNVAILNFFRDVFAFTPSYCNMPFSHNFHKISNDTVLFYPQNAIHKTDWSLPEICCFSVSSLSQPQPFWQMIMKKTIKQSNRLM